MDLPASDQEILTLSSLAGATQAPSAVVAMLGGV